jgi:hypothetical protein
MAKERSMAAIYPSKSPAASAAVLLSSIRVIRVIRGWFLFLASVWLGGSFLAAAGPARFVGVGADGKLVYEADRRGDRIPDFSHCGYGGGGVAIPDVPVRVVVAATRGDNRARIQAAIDTVSQLPADRQGIRGAVLLLAGRHEIAGCLRITTGGVVLRGQGQHPHGTVLVAKGVDRRALIQVAGKSDRHILSRTPAGVADGYVPVGARRLRLKSAAGLRAGDTILVERPSTAKWIGATGMDFASLPDSAGWLRWLPGKMDLQWDRVITGVEGDVITLDAPLTTALDAALGGGRVRPCTWPGRISQVGVESLRCESDFDPANPRDEEHAWMALSMDAVQNAWVRQLTAVHFASSAVALWEGCKGVTVEDCTSLQPVSEVGGFRRHSFQTSGQLTLFQRCRAEHGRHDFSVGPLAAGPNAFVACTARAAHDFSGPLGNWASGVLYDNVTIDGGGLSLTNREIWDQGAGWAAANCVLWQCTAPVITCRKPPTAYNWAIGCWGQLLGDGAWRSPNQFVKPASLYQAQLAERCGAKAVDNLKRRKVPTEAGAGKSIEVLAPHLVRAAARPAPSLSRPVSVRNGWLVSNDQLLVGSRRGTVWWRGSVLPTRAGEHGVGVTRFVPGRVGPGYTDDLDQLTDAMRSGGQAVLEHHWGLWYDRRRDDHQMVRRIDGNVWPPFYEQPWARSGKGSAWDGLSKYDLTKYNPWYFGRLKQFADLCDRKGLVLLHQAYFQHNVLEAGAHWADFPWRPANCLQDTGFPEPPPYVNGKRIFLGKAFYDVKHPVRRALHRAYIRKCLDTLGANRNVIYLTGQEYTGPLEFVQFWLDTAWQWQKETGKKVLLGLSCTKDVQDAILADPVRGPRVAVIDLRYWWYTADASLYAPRGGQDLAPRQHLRAWRGNRRRSDAQVARQVREYRKRYPDKAILCSLDRANGWAVLAGGGSIPNLRLHGPLLQALPRMKPFEPASGLAEGQWALAEPGQHYLVYSSAGAKVRLDLSADRGTYQARRLDPRTGRSAAVTEVRAGKVIEVPAPASAPWVLWLSRG